MADTHMIDVVNKHLEAFEFHPDKVATGKVDQVGDGVVKVLGLPEVAMGEIVTFSGGVMGLALNLSESDTGVVVLGDSRAVKQGDLVSSTGRILSMPVSDAFLGRVVTALGEPVDGKGAIKSETFYPMEKVAPGVMARKSVDTPLQTGIKAIDAMIPIGRGQRELIIGDRSTGKTAVALSTIINQRKSGVISIYVAIGQKRSSVSQTVATLEKFGAMDNTIIVTATASDPASQQFIAPYSATALAEYFLSQGKDVLVVYDDLSKHAWAYRELSLLLRRPSGREAYPGDVFYLHSRLLERACRLNPDHGGGSITALPIIETQANDVSAYIPTNVISITDGQIYLEADLFNAGQRPAINVGLSVSRVGSAAQTKAMKQVSGKLRLDLAQYRALAAFVQFSSDLDPKTKAQIDQGARMTELLKQHWQEPYTVAQMASVIWAGSNGHLQSIQIERVKDWETGFLAYLESKHSGLLTQIEDKKIIDEETANALGLAATAFTREHSDWLVPEAN